MDAEAARWGDNPNTRQGNRDFRKSHWLSTRNTILNSFLPNRGPIAINQYRSAGLYPSVDAPEFNLPLARRLRRRGLATAHLVSPSVWAWRAGRVRRIGASVDRMLCLFPFEPQIYTSRGIDASFVGHPLAQDIEPDPDRVAARAQLGLPGQGRVLALLPGSRVAEVRALAPLFLQVARAMVSKVPDLHFVKPVANAACQRALEPMLGAAAVLPLTTLQGSSAQAIAAADAVLLASGTATLEAALMRRPMVVAYRVDALSAWVLSRLLRSPYVALPNILARRELVPELLQEAATLPALEEALLPLLLDGPSPDWLADMDSMRQSLSREFSAEVVSALAPLMKAPEVSSAGPV